eukprot:UN02448
MVAVHSIEYTKLKAEFYLFSVFDPEKKLWLSVRDVESVALALGFHTPPKLYTGLFKSEEEAHVWCKKSMDEPSSLGAKQKEGFVFRNPNSFSSNTFEKNVAKYVRKGHVQTGKSRDFIKNWKRAKISQEYIEPTLDEITRKMCPFNEYENIKKR